MIIPLVPASTSIASLSLLFPAKHIQYKMAKEEPFVPRERIIEKQKYFQSIPKHTYLKGPYDKITSVAIPLALAVSSTYLIAKGVYNMSHDIGKKD